LSAGASAEPDAGQIDRRAHRLNVDLPVLSLRENVGLGYFPGMWQSLAATKSVTYLTHAALLELFQLNSDMGWSRTAIDITDSTLIAVFDLVALGRLPLSFIWMHEEWHRAVMSRRDIDSYNGIYDFHLGLDGLVPVRDVTDQDLIRLKASYPAEMVRLSSAGMEAQVAFHTELDKDRFFRRTHARVTGTEILSTLFLIQGLLDPAYRSDSITAGAIAEEGPGIEDRDFTGLDATAWVYDLFRPEEPYEARGPHPSGLGIDRYRSERDMTKEEIGYLRRQGFFSLVNLINPAFIGVRELEIDRGEGQAPWRWSFNFQHVPAPFGVMFQLNGFLDTGVHSWFLQTQLNSSDQLTLPGLALSLVREPLPLLEGATLTGTLQAWLQPRDQLFFASAARPGAGLVLRANVPLGAGVEAYVEARAKTSGWVIGDPMLQRNVDAHVGFQTLLF
jgi:hypothetical protein